MKPGLSRPLRLRLALIAFGISAAILSLHAWYYRRFMVDDAFISLRYADRLIHGQGLTWNDGDRVEGYTNLLWVLGCALLGKVGLDLVVAARVLGFLSSVAAIAALVWVHRSDTFRRALPGFAVSLAVALCGCVVIWTVGGLEQPLLTALLAWAIALGLPLIDTSKPRLTMAAGAGLLLGLIAITRADGAIFTLAVVCGIVVARGWCRETVRVLTPIAVIPLLFFLAQLAFRVAFYHELLPNSAYAKVGFAPERVATGLLYVAGGVYLAGLLVPAFLAFRLAGTSALKARVRFLGTILAVYLSYLILIGGDSFFGGRHLIPAVIVLAYLFGITLTIWIPRERSLRPVLWGVGFCMVTLAVFQVLDPRNAQARNESEQWVWDGASIGDLLQTAFGPERPLLAVDPAGCVPYFSRLPSLDMLGINDHYLAHHRPADFGRGTLGHELGSGAYVLSRKPDLVLFNLPKGGLRPYFRSGREMIFDPRSDFSRTFVPVTFESMRPRHLVSIVWARREGGAISIRRTPDRIQIPAFLFSSNAESRAQLDPDDRIGVRVVPQAPAAYSRLPVPPGHWRSRVESSGGDVEMSVWRTATGDRLAPGANGTAFWLAGGAPDTLTIVLETRGLDGAHVRSVTLERLTHEPQASAP